MPLTAGVCYCCKTAVAVGSEGNIHLAWRHVYPGNLRDIAFATVEGRASADGPQRVSEDRWMLQGCPDDGPAMGAEERGRVHIVWPTVVTDQGTPAESPVPCIVGRRPHVHRADAPSRRRTGEPSADRRCPRRHAAARVGRSPRRRAPRRCCPRGCARGRREFGAAGFPARPIGRRSRRRLSCNRAHADNCDRRVDERIACGLDHRRAPNAQLFTRHGAVEKWYPPEIQVRRDLSSEERLDACRRASRDKRADQFGVRRLVSVPGDGGVLRAREVHRRRELAEGPERRRVPARHEAVRLRPRAQRRRRVAADRAADARVRLVRRQSSRPPSSRKRASPRRSTRSTSCASRTRRSPR